MRQGRVAVVTGAAGGMGSVLVRRFLDNGDTVVASDLDRDALEALRAELDAGAKLVVAEADVSEEADCGRLADAAREAAGRVDVLVNCAGHFPIRPFAHASCRNRLARRSRPTPAAGAGTPQELRRAGALGSEPDRDHPPPFGLSLSKPCPFFDAAPERTALRQAQGERFYRF